MLGNPGNPAFVDRIQRLRDKSIAESYRARLERLLSFVSRLFGPEGVARAGSLEDKLFGCQPWTPLAFERLLLLAIAYPVVFLLIGWPGGEHGALGDFVVLPPAEISDTIQLLLVFRIVLYAAFRSGIALARGNSWIGYLIVDIIAAVAIPVPDDSAAFSAVFIAFAVAFFVTISGAHAVAGAVPGAFAVVVVVVAVGGDADADAVADADATVAFAFAYAVWVALQRAHDWAHERAQLVFFWISGWCFLTVYIALACFLVVEWGLDTRRNQGMIFLMFFGVLPLFNAPMDWLSFGVTRGLLRAMASGQCH